MDNIKSRLDARVKALDLAIAMLYDKSAHEIVEFAQILEDYMLKDVRDELPVVFNDHDWIQKLIEIKDSIMSQNDQFNEEILNRVRELDANRNDKEDGK